MKAIVFHQYGSPDVLRYEDIEKPGFGDDEVLIKVRAAAINPVDWHFMRGTPYIMRIQAGLRRPAGVRLGVDAAGRVEAVGKNVTQFKPGDHVLGACHGALAEYARASQSAIVMKPDSLTFEQAASLPVATFTALQGLRDKGRIQRGQKVLINGAAGGVGTFAVQIAKSFGADVTGVCSTTNVEMIRSIGANQVIDYTREDFTRAGKRYDLIFDSVGNHSVSAIRRALNPRGTYVVVGGPDGRWLGPLTSLMKAVLVSRFVSQNLIGFVAKRSQEDLATMCRLIETGTITPVVGKRYGLSEAPEAIRHLETGHARGKVVLTVDGELQ